MEYSNYPFQGFRDNIMKSNPENIELKTPSFNLLNRDLFRNNIPNIHNMTDQDLSIFIKNNIDVISGDILKNDQRYADLLRDNKFISCFIKAVNSIPIDYNTKLACNKVTYDYFISTNPDQSIKQKYLDMSRVVNKSDINKLIGLGLDETTACNLALCRNSSSNEITNSKRLNFALYYKDPNIINEQMVIWIYEKFFTRISDLFYAVMFEVYSIQEQEDFGENFMEIYSTVGLAVLTILNNMTTENITKVLIGYESEWLFKDKPSVRYSLHILSNDFSRITRVVDALTENNHFIP